MQTERRGFLKALALAAVSVVAGSQALPNVMPAALAAKLLPTPQSNRSHLLSADRLAAPSPWAAVDFTARLASVPGFSSKQLEAHVALYKGYVGKYNSITQQLATTPLEGTNATFHPYRELLVEQSFALNGALLHEAYFGNLAATATPPSPALAKVIHSQFGRWETFEAHLLAAAKSMRGWAVLGYQPHDRSLRWFGLDAHHLYSPMQTQPILVIDVYEHAYLIDFSTQRDAYLKALLPVIDWAVVEARLAHALHA